MCTDPIVVLSARPDVSWQGHTCDEHSWCSPGDSYEVYECLCKEGFKKDSRGDCVREVKTAIDYCERNTCPYHCRYYTP